MAQVEELVGKWAVRIKPVIKAEKDYGSGFSLSGYRNIPDTKYCTQPAKILKVENDVVYIGWLNYAGTITKEILSPEYRDENWMPVDAEFFGLEDRKFDQD